MEKGRDEKEAKGDKKTQGAKRVSDERSVLKCKARGRNVVGMEEEWVGAG